MSFLPGLTTLWDDLVKIFSFAPVIAALDPADAAGLAKASLAVAALQPTVQAVVTASGTPMTQEAIVAAVTTAVAQSSSSLSSLGLVSATSEQHVAAVAPLIAAAVSASGLAAAPGGPTALTPAP